VPEVVCRTLTREYRLVCPNAKVAEALAFVAARPDIVGAELATTSLAVVEEQGFLRLELPGGTRLEGDAEHVMSMLHGLFIREMLNLERGGAVVHCATVVHPGRPTARILVVGESGAGKTTLSLRLLDAGYAVEGDEQFIVWPSRAIARPRTLRVKGGSLAHVPRLAAAIAASPRIGFWDGAPLYAVDPAIAGRPWRIAEGGVEHVVFLEPNHGGLSHIKPIAAHEALRRLLAESVLPPDAVGQAVMRLRGILAKARLHALLLGDLDRALWQIGNIIA
jgi:hypothetical protein